MRIHNIYVDAAGETHWRDIEVELGRNNRTSASCPRACLPPGSSSAKPAATTI